MTGRQQLATSGELKPRIQERNWVNIEFLKNSCHLSLDASYQVCGSHSTILHEAMCNKIFFSHFFLWTNPFGCYSIMSVRRTGTDAEGWQIVFLGSIYGLSSYIEDSMDSTYINSNVKVLVEVCPVSLHSMLHCILSSRLILHSIYLFGYFTLHRLISRW